jgi:hypothetical protein
VNPGAEVGGSSQVQEFFSALRFGKILHFAAFNGFVFAVSLFCITFKTTAAPL